MSVAYLVIYFLCLLAALCCGVLAALSDFRTMTIPNRYCAAIAALFVPAWLAAHMAGVDVFSSLLMHLGAGAGIMLLTMAMYAVKALGAGDSKLMAAYGFWAGVPGVLAFVVYTAIAGAVLAAVTLLIVRLKPVNNPPAGSWIARAQGGERVVPYGLAIFAGALMMFIMDGFMTPDGSAVLTQMATE